jgi:hypothetical protein
MEEKNKWVVIPATPGWYVLDALLSDDPDVPDELIRFAIVAWKVEVREDFTEAFPIILDTVSGFAGDLEHGVYFCEQPDGRRYSPSDISFAMPNKDEDVLQYFRENEKRDKERRAKEKK